MRDDLEGLLLGRRFIRVDPDMGMMVLMEAARGWWQPLTTYQPAKKSGAPDFGLLNKRRGGKLLWKRK